MPDAARLVAALCLGLTGFMVSEAVMAAFLAAKGYNSFDFGWFIWVNAAVGVAVGWVSMGRRAGRGLPNAITNGLTGVFLLVLNGLFIQACNEMVRLAMKNRYDNALEAIVAVVEIGAEWGLILLNGPVIAILLVGAVVSGILTEYAWRTWR